VTFEYKIPTWRGRTLPPFPLRSPQVPAGGAPKLARLVALAHELEALVQSGRVNDYHGLARQAGVAPTRISQIVVLSQLAPVIQQYVLYLSMEQARLITEVQLREIARELDWDRQTSLFEQLVNQRR
jgi:hypothetical protein